MNPLLHTLPEDLTGAAVHNFRMNEFHDLSSQVGCPYRTCVLDHGYFYTEGLIIRDETGYELKVNVDYQLTGASNEIQRKAGRQACCVIVVVNPNVVSKIYVDAHMVGGTYCNLAPAIGQVALGLLNPTRKPLWKNITGKPDSYPVSGHWMALWDFYNFDDLQGSLKRITDGIKAKSRSDFDTLLARMTLEMQALDAQLQTEYDKLALHIANHNNPHRVTATQVGLDQVANYAPATQADVGLATSILNKYLTPLRGSQLITTNFLNQLTTHVSDYNNPHKVTAAQLNTYTITESNALFANKLGKTETATYTAAFNGYTYAGYYNYVRTGLGMGYLGAGRILPKFMAANPPGGGAALNGANGWTNLQQMFNTYAKKPTAVLYMQGNFTSIDAGVNQASVTFADMTAYPYGTIVLFPYTTTKTVGTGNGSNTEVYSVLMATVKTSSGWQY